MWWEKATAITLDSVHPNLLNYKAHSASNFDETDFIYLKALWRNKSVDQFHINDYVRPEYVSKADEFVGQNPSPVSGQAQQSLSPLRQSMIAFINTAAAPFGLDLPFNVELGPFSLSKMLLDQAKRANNEGRDVGDTLKLFRRLDGPNQEGQNNTAAEHVPLDEQLTALTIGRPTSRSQTPGALDSEQDRSWDEEIVRLSLHSLLTSITLCSGNGDLDGRGALEWVLTRQTFSLGLAGNIVYKVRTDGLLRNPENPNCRDPLVILDVKPYMRHLSRRNIEWQEACQMAAWISETLRATSPEKRRAGVLTTSDDTNRRRRILISQNYRSLYITVGEWGEGYESYLKDGVRSATLDQGNFLTMNCHGAYSLDNQEHMALFIRNLLALMMELSHPWEDK
ncbi:uncharacterized protein B0H64DRAFT_446713 [Chaetomium fimeti]|uniref:Uncharacterized protein n=1 Tax=Chaetomium fimeti TaxID=1854472 RepID=A0AAE0LMR4_9PEZI|nr:hypothetical protein B0H64DRAFT_446713 [Chaetomium fimeti]